MKIVYVANFFNHHHKPFCDAMNAIANVELIYVAIDKMSEERKKLGWSIVDLPPYVRSVYMNDKRSVLESESLIYDADIVIMGTVPFSLVKRRLHANKPTFRYSERLYKSSLRYLKAPVHWYRAWRTRKCRLLCSGAYVSRDYSLTDSYIGRFYKWAYFPKFERYDILDALVDKKLASPVHILWAGRFIDLKHPELVVYVAKKLKSEGVNFICSYIGTGPLELKIKKTVDEAGLADRIRFWGQMSPEEVREHMKISPIFLFTSDRNEGWGAVLNESMNSACAVVANEQIGATRYLIENGKNGLLYKDRDFEDLYKKVKWLCEHPQERREMGKRAYMTIANIWNADQAAQNFIRLNEAIASGFSNPIFEGPCSTDYPLSLDGYTHFNISKYNVFDSIKMIFKDLLSIISK